MDKLLSFLRQSNPATSSTTHHTQVSESQNRELTQLVATPNIPIDLAGKVPIDPGRVTSSTAYSLHESYDPTSIKTVDETVWRTAFSPETLALHGLTFENTPTLDTPSVREALKHLNSLKLEQAQGIAILTLPNGLTYEKLIALAKAPIDIMQRSNFEYDLLPTNLRDISIGKTFQVAVTNYALEGTRGMSNKEHQQHAAKMDVELLGVVPAIALAILNPVLFPRSSGWETQCAGEYVVRCQWDKTLRILPNNCLTERNFGLRVCKTLTR